MARFRTIRNDGGDGDDSLLPFYTELADMIRRYRKVLRRFAPIRMQLVVIGEGEARLSVVSNYERASTELYTLRNNLRYVERVSHWGPRETQVSINLLDGSEKEWNGELPF